MELIKLAMATDLLGNVIAILRSSELLSNLLLSDPLAEVAASALNDVLRLKKRCIT